jgi:hypothetical protein
VLVVLRGCFGCACLPPPKTSWSIEMTQEFPYPAKLFADAAKSFQELSGQNLNAMNAYMPPLAQALAKFNLEMMRFTAKRVVECSELPEKLGKCQSTPDMFKQQMGFIESMRQQYTEEWFRLMEILGDMSWQNYRPDSGLTMDAAPGWNAMTAWMQKTASQSPQKRDDQPGAAQPLSSAA